MAVSFQLKPRKGQKRPSVEPQGEPVEHIGEPANAEETAATRGPQWFERPRLSLEQQLQVLPEAPTDADYDAVPIDEFLQRVTARMAARSQQRKRARND